MVCSESTQRATQVRGCSLVPVCSLNLRAESTPESFYVDVENPPLPTSNGGESQVESGYTDGSGALFSMYLDRAEEEDTKTVERWKGDADGILVFVRCPGLFTLFHMLIH